MEYRIVCTEQEPVGEPTAHDHIVGVGTVRNAEETPRRWPLAEVLGAMDHGDAFYTLGERSGRSVWVLEGSCPACGGRIIRSIPDSAQDNNLEELRRCLRG